MSVQILPLHCSQTPQLFLANEGCPFSSWCGVYIGGGVSKREWENKKECASTILSFFRPYTNSLYHQTQTDALFNKKIYRTISTDLYQFSYLLFYKTSRWNPFVNSNILLKCETQNLFFNPRIILLTLNPISQWWSSQLVMTWACQAH